MTLLDTNVVIDLLTGNPTFAAWSVAQFVQARDAGGVAINDVVFAEIAMGYRTVQQVEQLLADRDVERHPMPSAALFRAGKAFLAYRRAGGPRTSVLPDFFIGAHAAVMGWPLLTRDARTYKTYFPDLTLITP